MKTIQAARFKQCCLALLDELGPQGIVITKRGRPVAKVVPLRSDCRDLIGSLKGKIEVRGEIFSTGLRWDAQS